jgi:Ca2+-binding EF-hand superfamily protein
MFCTCFGWFFSCVRPRNPDFEDADIDHDGRLSLNEFHAYYVRKYCRPPTNEEWMRFHFADKNNNGYISKYDIELFEKHSSVL